MRTKAVDRVALSRARQPAVPGWVTDLFAPQLEMLRDPSKAKLARCGRRAGKTHLGAVALVEHASRHPHAVLPYLALTAKSARLILWPSLKQVNQKYGVGLRVDESTLTATHPNGAQVVLFGADDERKVERLRGGAYPLVVVDEAAAFPLRRLEYLVEEVLEPALLDYDGELWMLSTPNAACAGYFYDADHAVVPGWANWHWSVLDNPHLAHAQAYLTRKRAQKKWSEDHPVYKREWLGEWLRSTDSLLFPFDRERNGVASVPDAVEYVLGVDLGASDDAPSTAFVVCAYDKSHVYVVRSYARAGMIPSTIADEIRALQQAYDPVATVVDAGGLGKGYVNEFRQRHGLSVLEAEKATKAAALEMVSGDLRTGVVKVVCADNESLLDEWRVAQWDEDHAGPDDRHVLHLSDAALYAYRRCRHYGREHEVDPAPPPVDQGQRYIDALVERTTDRGEPWWRQRPGLQTRRRTSPR